MLCCVNVLDSTASNGLFNELEAARKDKDISRLLMCLVTSSARRRLPQNEAWSCRCIVLTVPLFVFYLLDGFCGTVQIMINPITQKGMGVLYV